MRKVAQGAGAALLLCCSCAIAGAQAAAEIIKPAPKEKPAVAKKAAPAKKVAAAKKEADKKKKQAQKKPVAAALAPQAIVVNIQNQFRPKFEKLYKIELAFVKRICDLSAQQQQTLSTEAAKSLDRTVKKHAGGGGAQLRGGKIRVINGRRIPSGHPRKLVQDEIQKLLKKHLSAEQAKRYQSEISAREESHKRASAQFLVAKLDEQLLLSGQQREDLTEALHKKWQENWEQTLRYMLNNNHSFPQVPDGIVRRFLDKKQKAVWRRIQKANFGHNQNFGFEVGVVVVDDFDIKTDNTPQDAALADQNPAESR